MDNSDEEIARLNAALELKRRVFRGEATESEVAAVQEAYWAKMRAARSAIVAAPVVIPSGPSPIETTYSGVRFRSRLEARWALYFDELGIQWFYEAEGYELPSGRYLPDFWLPRWRMFVEIKPVPPTDAERVKCLELHQATGHAVSCFCGMPGYERVFAWDSSGMGVEHDPPRSDSLADAAAKANAFRFWEGGGR